ncbi:MAG: IS3 family transposase [Firmicutes bacterium]|nr:IS3 family transposase [Bacillota bacterium]
MREINYKCRGRDRDRQEYVELFYNRKRMHSYLDYMSPVEYRLAHSA